MERQPLEKKKIERNLNICIRGSEKMVVAYRACCMPLTDGREEKQNKASEGISKYSFDLILFAILGLLIIKPGNF